VELLGFIYKKCDSTEHQKLVFEVLDFILGRINKICPAGENEKVDSLLKDIREKLEVEVDTASQLNELDGLLEMIESKI
jgi:UTP15 C terminal